MKFDVTDQVSKLEDIPNIGKSIAADLRGIGIAEPTQLAELEPLAVYLNLATQMGKRLDPCVLYTLLAARHYLRTGEAVKWWEFTEEGKAILEELKQVE